MITDQLIEDIKKFATNEAETKGLPAVFHLDLSYQVGQRLAKELEADAKVVALGTLLMDCMLGQAFEQGIKEQHVEMSRDKAEELLEKDQDISAEEVENVLACVSQHHGVDKFYSIESEICCNADCYRSASINGVLGGIHNGRKMELGALKQLYLAKAEEKWNAISLDTCKEELKGEYDLLTKLMKD